MLSLSLFQQMNASRLFEAIRRRAPGHGTIRDRGSTRLGGRINLQLRNHTVGRHGIPNPFLGRLHVFGHGLQRVPNPRELNVREPDDMGLPRCDPWPKHCCGHPAHKVCEFTRPR